MLAVSYGATLRLYGLDGATFADTKDPATLDPQDSGMSWARLNTCPGNINDTTLKCNKGVLQGESSPSKGDGAVTLTVDGPANRKSPTFNGVNWKPEDQIVITTTDYLPGHTEVATIDSLADCTGPQSSRVCKTIKIKSGLKFPHNASIYDLSAKIPAGKGLTNLSAVDGRAAVGLLSRSISIVSGGEIAGAPLPEPGEKDADFGGHTVIRQGFKQVQIQGVQFFQMGQ